jgi:hypothetical protein
MNRIRHLAYLLGALTGSVLALGSTPAFAIRVPPPGGWDDRPIVRQQIAGMHLAASGGTPGWQITLIATAAALLAATLAIIVDRARTARRHAPAGTA